MPLVHSQIPDPGANAQQYLIGCCLIIFCRQAYVGLQGSGVMCLHAHYRICSVEPLTWASSIGNLPPIHCCQFMPPVEHDSSAGLCAGPQPTLGTRCRQHTVKPLLRPSPALAVRLFCGLTRFTTD
jgi:hypothetical protein